MKTKAGAYTNLINSTEVFGMFGFTFDLPAFGVVASLQKELRKLKKEVEDLKQKLPHS